jgi:hypothetical protein
MTNFTSLNLEDQEAEMLREFLRNRPELGIDPNSDNILEFKSLIQQKLNEASANANQPSTVQIEFVQEKSLVELLDVPFNSLSVEEQESIMLKEYIRTHQDYAPQHIAIETLKKLERLAICQQELLSQLNILFSLTPNTQSSDQLRTDINSMISQVTNTVSKVRILIN